MFLISHVFNLGISFVAQLNFSTACYTYISYIYIYIYIYIEREREREREREYKVNLLH